MTQGGGCRGGSGSGLGRVWAWEGAKGRARWRGEVSPGPFGRGRAVDTGGVRRAARNRAPERREMEVRAFLRFLKFQGPLGNLKISPILRAQMKRC